MSQVKKNHKCKLPRYEVEEILTIQEVRQQHGWPIKTFELTKAWEYSQGEDVKIAVLDSGVDLDHPDLLDNLLPGINIINKKMPPQDDNQHGTHLAGIIAATNNGIGMVGVAPKSKIIPVKVLNASGNGNMLHVAEGIRWAADQGVDFICMSLGTPRPLAIVRKAIQYANSKGVVLFAAAGNAGLTKEIYYPANYPEVISIGSIDENLDRSKFSNTGDNLDFVAPGGRIFSTVPDDWYAYLSGTSMACPFAVGLAALCLSYQRKHLPEKQLKNTKDYIDLFKKHTIPIANSKYAGKIFYQGYGILDPRKFVEWVKNG